MQLLMAQINTVVGDFRGNTEQVLATARTAMGERSAAVIVFPELTLSGYPPEDLLLRPSIGPHIEECLARLCTELPRDAWVILGYPRRHDGLLYNCAGVIHEGEVCAEYRKQELPNYEVFDEKRYFTAGHEPCVLSIDGVPFGLTICEDIWSDGPATAARAAGAEVLMNINASPYHRGKQAERLSLVCDRARALEMDIVYVNQVGGQDELVFDGGSFAVDARGEVVVEAARFEPALIWTSLRESSKAPRLAPGDRVPAPAETEAVWKALTLGVKDYVDKNGFPGVVLGLSGGVDSALTLAVAVEALGAERVEAVMMPFRYTSQISVDDAAQQSATLGVRHSVIPIEGIYASFMAALEVEFEGLAPDTTEENLQARCRGVLLMSISNKKGSQIE
ncbi:MAG: NAD+ synthase, partial [Pseudomonadota bacterium]